MPTFAAVDIGSNSVRIKIARLVRHRLVTIHEDREVTRLGKSVFKNGMLTPSAMARTVEVLQRFHKAAQKTGAHVVRVVATSALRDARNGRAFMDWVRSAGSGRGKLRAHRLCRRTHPLRHQPAAGRGAADGRIPQARSSDGQGAATAA